MIRVEMTIEKHQSEAICRIIHKVRISLVLISFFLFIGCGDNTPLPLAEKGTLDLSDWDFTQNGPVDLEGEWEFFWETLADPNEGVAGPAAQTPNYIQVPGLWSKSRIEGETLPAQGYATYRLKIVGLNPSQLHTLYIRDILSVGNIWINGHLFLSGGQVGKNRKSENPGMHSLITRFQNPGNTTEIMLHVSNFSNMEGGINTSVRIGPDRQIQREINRIWITISILGGALLLLGIYHMALFAIRRNEASNLYFGLYCLMWASQTLFGVNGGCLMAELFSSLPWRVSIDATLYPFGFMPALMVMFYHALFPNRSAKTINRVFQTAGGAFVLYLIFTPPNAFDNMALGFGSVFCAACLYLFGMFLYDLRKKRKNIFYLLPGYLILALTGVNDALSDLHILNTGSFVPYGAFLFILSYSFLISVRFSQTFAAVESLSGRLEIQNKELFQAVRTARENLRLKKELDIREKRELKLKVMQGRLSSMLNQVEDALLAVTPEQQIVFSNRAVETLTGYRPDRLIGFSLDTLFEEISREVSNVFESRGIASEGRHLKSMVVKCLNQGITHVDVTASLLDLEDEQLMVIILKKTLKEPLARTLSEPLELITALNRNRGRLETMEVILNRESQDLLGKKDKEALDALVCLLDGLRELPSDKPTKELKRLLAVRVMNAVCSLWTTSTRMTKAELADKSGLWSVYIEKDGYARTQTLDKYLSINTLPARPKWKTILSTAELVLAACDTPGPMKNELETLVKELKSIL